MRVLIRIILVFSFFCGLSNAAFSQEANPDHQLARHYLDNGEYDKAILYYEKLYKQSPNDYYYQQLLESYTQSAQLEDAEKLVKKHIKRFQDGPTYRLDLGRVYQAQNEPQKARDNFKTAIKLLPANHMEIRSLARAFMDTGEMELAEQTLNHGRKMLKGSYPLNLEFAELYLAQDNLEGVIDEYLGLLEINEGYQSQVQSRLAQQMDFTQPSPETSLLKTQLIKRVQSNQGLIFNEMLIWLYLQQGQFDQAFIQAKALDKRNDEDGGRLMAIGRTAHNSQQYELAIKSYDYVIGKGPASYYNSTAKAEKLEVMKDKITAGSYTTEELQTLSQAYELTIQELGQKQQTIEVIRDLARLKAYYMNDVDGAIELLTNALDRPRISNQQKAWVKLDLGDLLVIKNNIWDASLYYMQVDNDFKYDQLGEQAKYKNALVAYYTGDFKWAQAQLDVLKGSTSRLIANDAMELSLRITDNSTIDTTTRPLHLFAQAELLVRQNLFSAAQDSLNQLIKQYPYHALEDDVWMLQHQMAVKNQQYDTAAYFLKRIIAHHSDGILADNAVFLLGDLMENQLNDLAKAQEYYEIILFDFPGSLFVIEARKRARKLRGDQIN